MLKPLTTTFKGREISLECTHKREFPPPQMYGSTPDDIHTLWKQGTIDQNQYQHLQIWHEKCGLMVMGPRCLDCPLALKRNPRPGRPNVIETENWLEAKNKMHWADMKAGKLAPEGTSEAQEGSPQMSLSEDENTPLEGVPFSGQHDEEYPVDPVEPEATSEPEPEPEPEPKPKVRRHRSKREVAKEMIDNGILESEPDNAPSTEKKVKPLEVAEEQTSIADILSSEGETEEEIEAEDEEGSDLDDDIISALADD